VQAQAERSQLRIDRDELRFSVTSSKDGYLYVLLAGPDGSLIQLYPNDKATNNRVAANQTLHLPQSSWSNPALFYQAAPANYYSKFWHDHDINRLSYGFPYDDYAEQSSFISHGNPQWLLVAVGF